MEDNDGDVDATVEFLIGLKAIGEDEHWELPHRPDPAGGVSSSAASAASAAGCTAKDVLASMLAASDPEKKCPCGSGQLFKACCMKRLQSSLSSSGGGADEHADAHAHGCRKRGATPPPAPAAATEPVAAKFPTKLSNRERKEQQRQKKQREQDEMGGFKRDKGKVKTRPGAEPAAAAAIKVVGI